MGVGVDIPWRILDRPGKKRGSCTVVSFTRTAAPASLAAASAAAVAGVGGGAAGVGAATLKSFAARVLVVHVASRYGRVLVTGLEPNKDTTGVCLFILDSRRALHPGAAMQNYFSAPF